MGYWISRANLEYYAVVRAMLESLGPLGSIADIGCEDTPVACWGVFGQRWAVDMCERQPLPGVRRIVGTWPDCETLLPTCDVVTCLQVLEHVAEPAPFVAALFAAARRAVIISVPWEWPAGQCKSHVHDPVDDAKLREWTHRRPAVKAIVGTPARAVCLYAVSGRLN
jgi:hypothetical protein